MNKISSPHPFIHLNLNLVILLFLSITFLIIGSWHFPGQFSPFSFNFSLQFSQNVFWQFKQINGSIIKEERKEETERSKKGKEEEKNNSNASKNDKKRINLSSLTPLKLKNKSKDKENKNERKIKSFVKSDSHSSLIIDSNRSYNHSGVEENS